MSVGYSSRASFALAVGNAREIALCAYALLPGSSVVRALEAAADRGARVSVRLDGHPAFGHPTAPACEDGLGRELSSHGIAFAATGPNDPPAHLKAAIVDGRAYLDDRNWASKGPETIVRDDDPRDVAAIGEAIAGRSPAPQPDAARPIGDLALDKRAAIALEAAAIAAAPGDRIDVATETFGCCAVSVALLARARAGTHVRLEVSARTLAADRSGRERALLGRLEEAGVAVRTVDADEKFAVLGDRAWVGSANATFAPGPMSDWGAVACDPAIVAERAAAFARAWRSGVTVPVAATMRATVE